MFRLQGTAGGNAVPIAATARPVVGLPLGRSRRLVEALAYPIESGLQPFDISTVAVELRALLASRGAPFLGQHALSDALLTQRAMGGVVLGQREERVDRVPQSLGCHGLDQMVPDFHQVSPVAREALFEFRRSSPFADLFWFHRTLNTLDSTDSNAVAAVLVAGFLVTTLVAERRSDRTPTAVADAYETYLDTEQ